LHQAGVLIYHSLSGVCPTVVFNKHFLHFCKQLIKTTEERSTRRSRLTKCVQGQKRERRAGTWADQSCTWDHV